MKDELGGKIMTKFVELRPKTYIQVTVVKIKKQKAQKTVPQIENLSLKIKKNNLEATQFENKINHLGKNQIDIDSIKKNRKKFIKNNKLISQTQQRFKSEKHNVFTEEINKVSLSSNDEKRMQSIDFIETYAYGTRKDLVSEKVDIKCSSIKLII